ncbi:MAG TPA: hypothetical protein VGD80_18780 [Kofleriaceae bacterium]
MHRKRNILTVLLLSAAPVAASPDAHAPPPDSKVSKPLLDLRMDLIRMGRDKAQSDLSRFRPLCDKDGYPLVGNMANKGNYQPSQFCSDVRKAEKRS